MLTFAEIQKVAAEHSGGAQSLATRMPEIPDQEQLLALDDAECLSMMSFRVFSTGLNQQMVRNKWPAFEEVFFNFNPGKIAFMSDEALENLMQETRIIRHWGKIKATRENAIAMSQLAKEFGGIGKYLHDWPLNDSIGLWEDIKKRFSQMGGNSGPYFLRMVGKDGFILTRDVVKALNDLGVAEGKLTSKRDRALVQDAFNRWHEETKMPYAHLSRILAIYTG